MEFFHYKTHTAIRKDLVYTVECANTEPYFYIQFNLEKDHSIYWKFDTSVTRDKVFEELFSQ